MEKPRIHDQMMQFSETVFPIRVIDIVATLGSSAHTGGIRFHTPADWDFHVISHTWSLGVRRLSKTIGKQLDIPSSNYNRAFETADFRADVCYGQLIEFFSLLIGDGVKRIWFDALCINQEDLDEKSREISHMGAYYSNSRGCYVLLHGVGEGYKAWNSTIDTGGVGIHMNESAPRWFTRVWTLQEFMLPEKLYFLVGGLSQWTVHHINKRIRTKTLEPEAAGCCFSLGATDVEAAGFCRCCLLTSELYSQSEFQGADLLRFVSGDIQDAVSMQGDHVLEPETSHPCRVCASLPLIRRIPGLQSGEIIYFIDKDAYLFVVSIERWASASDPSRLINHLSNDYGALLNLFNLQEESRYQMSSPWRIIAAIAKRQCSVDEDRILGILSLLRLELTQLRAGKLLEEQIVAMAKVCSADLLIHGLLAVDRRGSTIPGMSWAPTFRSSIEKLNGLGDQEVISEIKVVNVCLQGMRLAGCKIVRAHIRDGIFDEKTTKPFKNWCPIFIDTIDMTLAATHEYTLPHFRGRAGLYCPGAIEMHFNTTWWDVAEDGENIGYMELNWFEDYATTFSIEFALWIVLLGQTSDHLNRMRLLTMVCVGHTVENLHKVGLISFPLDLGITLFQHSLSSPQCCIGGFGLDLSDHVTLCNLS